jgi:hypothetical protein
MIKKLLCAGLLFTGVLSTNAQQKAKVSDADITRDSFIDVTANQNKTSVNPIPDGDTLGYFRNKQAARNTGTAVGSFYTVKSPYVQTGTVQPVITEFGSSFLNPGGASVTVYGAYVLAMRHGASVNPTVNIRVYIYSASPTGIPGTKLDSAMTSVTNSVSGTYNAATFTTPVVVTGAFFISYKPIAPTGDTIRAFINNAYSPTGTLTPTTQRYGEGLSYTRFNGALTSNTGFYGAGTDFENIVVPFVSFSYSAGATAMPTNTTNGYCANLPITFTSTSAPASILENRQFNWNAFAPAWLPYVNTASLTTLRTADPIYNWSFAGVTPTGVATSSNPTYTFGGNGTANVNLIVKYQHSSIQGLTSKSQNLATAITMTIVNCGITGINANSSDANMSVYPNPAINGKANVTGLQGVNTIAVYNMLGQVVSTQTSDKEEVSIDLSNQAPGTYMLRITDSANNAKVLKVINN